ncbi:MAG: HDOD domain-containing protein [Candidatus Eisenbacteria bacterium]
MEGATARQPSSSEAVIRTLLERKIEDGELQLPVLSTVVTEVLDLTRSNDSSAGQLSDIIHRDQTLAGHVLRVANSPLYLPNMPIVSLQQAISRLGLRIIGEVAVALSVKEIAFDVRGYEDEVRFLWRHAAAAGGFAREIARHLRSSVESALLCGLLQNVGKPVLLQLIREASDQLGEELDKESTLSIVEDYHTLVGSRMAGAWGLPEVVATAVHFHHDPASAPKYQDQTRITGLSDILANHLLGVDPSVMHGRAPGLTLLERPASTDQAPKEGGDDDGGAGAMSASISELSSRLADEHPDFAELGMYPEDVAALLARSDQIRETMEIFG